MGVTPGRSAALVGLTLKLVFFLEPLTLNRKTGCTGGRDAQWGRSPRHLLPSGVLTLPLHCLGGGVGASQVSPPRGASKHHSLKQEAGLEISFENAQPLGILVCPSFQGS